MQSGAIETTAGVWQVQQEEEEEQERRTRRRRRRRRKCRRRSRCRRRADVVVVGSLCRRTGVYVQPVCVCVCVGGRRKEEGGIGACELISDLNA